MKSANPERTYDFMNRNFTETMDIQSFRQILNRALDLEPDIITSFYDKDNKETDDKTDFMGRIGKPD